MTTTATWTEEKVAVAGTEMQILKGGSGDPLLILHDEMGQPGWRRVHEELAQNYTVYAPSLPGFGVTDRLEWVMNVRDISTWTLWAMEEIGLSSPNVLGFSLGGWIAAEMATQSPGAFRKMALVAPGGILPPTGEILDMFLIVSKEFITAGVHDTSAEEFQAVCPDEPTPEQVEVWETAREEACRLTWRPVHARPQPAAPAGTAEGPSVAGRLGPERRGHTCERRRGVQRIHRRVPPGHPRELRPPLRFGQAGRADLSPPGVLRLDIYPPLSALDSQACAFTARACFFEEHHLLPDS